METTRSQNTLSHQSFSENRISVLWRIERHISLLPVARCRYWLLISIWRENSRCHVEPYNPFTSVDELKTLLRIQLANKLWLFLFWNKSLFCIRGIREMVIPKEDSTDPQLLKSKDGKAENFVRSSAEYKDYSSRFKERATDFSKQFSHMYACRLDELREILIKKSLAKWGKFH